ncbi:hypothetical protein [Xanthomonas translucens]|uniref:Conserved hypothetical membrane protein n=1 Tax=Xanthomonas translucens pv. translucens DSM 18974 TaxID=1261556 RepID=A0A1C3TR74_XANCT|nr:hypothetical protein [Xanthomonas translucens]KTF40160.1 hypothetical protein OZ12_08370 [Xanthomonas translucens pv. translucens]KWV14984.1 hypothetical protein ATB54_11035 [Xanthomonas translucens]MCC8446568.1 hypothetical protein [Xanthomonas translucens pv. translucens]MCS3359798.1 hypothetical protein [Xanthomonas translucens pv. translucens]MCS3373415.1 hypothetical protein [Xanthomonas translucens pv. translucens]
MDTQSTPALTESNPSNDAQQEACKALATLAATLQRQVQRLQDQVAQQLQALNAAANNADHKVNRVVENALPRLTQLTQQALSMALDPAAERFDRTLTAADQTLQQATQRYAQAQQSLEATALRRMWMGSIAMLAAALMGLCGVGYALYSAKAMLAEAEQRRAEIAYLDRVARANLVPCGEDRLCAEVEKKGPHYGDHGQYRVITLRQSPAR